MYDDRDPISHRIRQDDNGSNTGWAMGVLLVLLLVGAVLMFSYSDRTKTNTAPNRPSATVPTNPPSTTGSSANTDQN